MSAIQLIAATLLSTATPGMKPKALLAAVREKHPEASKKEIVRAAFYALTDTTEIHRDAALQLQEFAIGERGSGDHDEPASKRPRKKLKAKKKTTNNEQAVKVS